jgi:hypothetical protein
VFQRGDEIIKPEDPEEDDEDAVTQADSTAMENRPLRSRPVNEDK